MFDARVIAIESAEDPRLEPFRDLRNRNLTRVSRRFVAEGWNVIERLLRSEFETEIVLCSPKYVDQVTRVWQRPGIIYLMEDDKFPQLVGFNFHRGVLAYAKRAQYDCVEALVSDSGAIPKFALWCGVMGVQDPENLGTILRTCSGLGIERVWIGPDCCDPFSRRVLRTSMGNSLKLKLVGSENAACDLKLLQAAGGFQIFASSLTDDAKSLSEVSWSERSLILFGNEGHGLPIPIQAASDVRLKIDMSLGTDSLNVSVAAGIILHYAARLAPVPYNR
jgi:tRNA G18 (ribose-2'-O)-methylase SpoU